MNTKKIVAALWMIVLVATAHTQNINNPNKRGPLGTQVNTLSGNLFLPRTDFYIAGRALDMDISFYYNSYLLTDDVGFGKGWSFKYAIQYKNDTIPGRKLFFWGDGREDGYDLLPGGGYKPPRGFFSKLEQYQPGKFRLTEPDNFTYFFDNATHRKITRIEDLNGNFINFSYTDSLLTSLVNGTGQSVTFTYNPAGRLIRVTDAIAEPSRAFTYTYDAAGNLKEVTDPLGGKYHYTYLINGPMATLADKNGNKVNIIYSADFSTSEIIGCNKRMSFAYDTATKTTVVTDYLEAGNQVTKYSYHTIDSISWISSVSGNCCGYNMSYEYDAEGNMIKMKDANGQVYTYTYDEKGNTLTATDPLGGVSTYTYTALNLLNTFKDPKGHLYSMSYDSDGNLTQMVTPGNNVYTAVYNASGDITSSTDPLGNTYTYSYDAYGNPTMVSGPNGYHATLSFDARGKLLAFSDARGNSNSAEYDILDRLKKITDPINNSMQFTYDAEGNIISFKNQNNETSIYSYDASNRVVKVTGPTGNHVSLSYDGMDNLLSLKNAIGNEMRVSYDSRNRLSSIKMAEDHITSFTYDGNGNAIRADLPNGNSIYYTYDLLNRVTTIRDADGVMAGFTYDKNGNVASYTNGAGAITTAIYDSLDRIKQVTDPLGNSKLYAYDKNGNVITVTDREGRISYYTYDELDRVKTHTDNNGFTVTMGYDAQNNVISLKDQNNNITSYTYDSLNRRKTMVYPDGRYQQYFYDKKDNITGVRLTDATVVTYQYDTLNRVTSRTLPNGEVYSYTYDKLNRVVTMANNNGIISFAYDNLGRIIAESFGGKTTNYAYNLAGRTQTTVYPDGTEVIKEYDSRNRVTRILKDSVTVVEYAYNNANQLINKSFSNGVSTTMQYDFANRLNNISTRGGVIQNTSFTYDKEYHTTSVIRGNNPSLSEKFIYDNGYRLVNYKRGPDGSPLVENTYTYDAVGNRTAANLDGITTTYSVNNLNQLTGVNGVAFTFDNRGNITYDGTYYKSYDPENRLIKDSSSPSNVISYAYDALNRRIAKTTNGSILKYTYSGAKQIEVRDGGNNLLNRTVFAGFLSPLTNEKNGNAYYYHQNELGSVEAITNGDGRLIEKYQYDAYGKLSRFDSLNNPLASSIAGNRFGFTGQEYDSATGSYRFFYRNYSPGTGVFNQRDLIEYQDGMGMYQYVGNNPANGVDVWGLEDCPGREEIGYKVSFSNEVIVKMLEKGADYELMFKTGADKQWSKIHKGEYKRLMERSIESRFNTTDRNVGGKSSANSYSADAKGHMESAKSYDAKVSKTNADVGGANAKGLDALGKGMNVLDNLVKGEAFASSLVDGETNPQHTQEVQAGGDLALSLLGWTGPGAVYGTLDFAVETVTGKGITTHTAEAGQFWGDYLYNDASERDREAYQYAKSMGKGKQWLETRRRMDERQRSRSQRTKSKCPEGGTRKPGRWVWDPVRKMWVLVPIDPNMIIGPDGQPAKKWVSVKDRMPYTILFENDSLASARTRYIRITTPVEPKQDPASLELGSFGFNNQSFEIPSGTSAYYQRLDCRDSTGLYVDITAGYDVINNQVFWEFQGIDPLTLLAPEDPLAGFLFLQDATRPEYGNGFVNFSIKPIASAVTLDTIGAKASIIFDSNEEIPTNIHTNTIDAVAPTSSITGLPALTPDTEVSLTYTGSDDVNGSGIKHYSIYVSDNDGPPELYVSNFTGSDTLFKGLADHMYRFYVTATDTAGNVELMKLVDSVRIISGEQVICPNGNITFNSRMNGTTFQWQVDNGTGYTNITDGGIYSGAPTADLSLTSASTGMYGYKFRCLVNGVSYSQEFLLKFGMTWEGTIDETWENPANWSCGTLPDMNTDVTVNGGKANQPVLRSNATIRTLRFGPGASGTVSSGFNLTILK